MDHLQTSEERKARWYSVLQPRYVQVHPAKSLGDLDVSPLDRGFVYSIPLSWLKTHCTSVESDHLPPTWLRKVVEKNGFAIISGILTQEECHKAIELAWDWVEAASFAEKATSLNDVNDINEQTCGSPVQRDKPESYSSAFFPRSVEGGMLPYYGSGHSSFAWYIRSHENVKTVFERYYETDDLVASLDGIVLWRSRHKTDAGWFHVDQNPRFKPNPSAIQSIVNLLAVSRETGGNVIVCGSHDKFRHFDSAVSCCHDFYSKRLDEVGSDDWLEIDPKDTDVLEPKRLISALLNQGDMLIWDSRTVHCSYPGNTDSVLECQSHRGFVRAATCVSMMPTSVCTEQVLKERRNAVDASRTLTHWVNKASPLGEERADEASLEMDRINMIKQWEGRQRRPKVLLGWDELNDEQKRLVSGGKSCAK